MPESWTACTGTSATAATASQRSGGGRAREQQGERHDQGRDVVHQYQLLEREHEHDQEKPCADQHRVGFAHTRTVAQDHSRGQAEHNPDHEHEVPLEERLCDRREVRERVDRSVLVEMEHDRLVPHPRNVVRQRSRQPDPRGRRRERDRVRTIPVATPPRSRLGSPPGTSTASSPARHRAARPRSPPSRPSGGRGTRPRRRPRTR